MKTAFVFASAAVLALSLSACSQPVTQSAAPATPVAAAGDSAQVVLDRHVVAIKAGDMATLMADYADDTVVVTPPGMIPPPAGLEKTQGVFLGKENAAKLFSVLTDAEHIAGTASMVSTTEPLSPDTILLHWTVMPGTPQETVGMDSFTIRNGKIVFQTVAIKSAPATTPAP